MSNSVNWNQVDYNPDPLSAEGAIHGYLSVVLDGIDSVWTQTPERRDELVAFILGGLDALKNQSPHHMTGRDEREQWRGLALRSAEQQLGLTAGDLSDLADAEYYEAEYPKQFNEGFYSLMDWLADADGFTPDRLRGILNNNFGR